MRINEITISDPELTFDILKDNIAARVHSQYLKIESRSDKFIISAIDSYDPEELSELIEEMQNNFRKVTLIFDLESQTFQLIKYLITYLTD